MKPLVEVGDLYYNSQAHIYCLVTDVRGDTVEYQIVGSVLNGWCSINNLRDRYKKVE